MSPIKNLYYWGTSSFSGPGQLDEGPWSLGGVNKILRAEVRGGINYQGADIVDTSVFGNFLMWGLYWVDHGAGPLDVVTSTDNDQFMLREQTSGEAVAATWSPSTDTAAVLATLPLRGNWSGQVAIGVEVDVYLSFAPPFGGSTANLNTFGTVQLWWA